jgi:ribonuclease HI
MGTNNIGEFLALVHALALQKKNHTHLPIYTDSGTAMALVRNKKVKSNLPRNEQTKDLWNMIGRAENWLKNNETDIRVLKWDTTNWGEIPADFGRK